MILKDGEKLRCPKCGGSRFYATAHVTQDWELDAKGFFVDSVNNCVEVTHAPDAEDLWECKKCGYNAEGMEFITMA